MEKSNLTRATLGRLPEYLEYIESLPDDQMYISATKIAEALNLGDVLVRKDLRSISDGGRPRVGFRRDTLVLDINSALMSACESKVVVVGVGNLGKAILEFRGFSVFDLDIVAGFDSDPEKWTTRNNEKPVYPVNELKTFCRDNDVRIGIITVSGDEAQNVCNLLVESGINAIWNFSQTNIEAPMSVIIENENLALKLAHLNSKLACITGGIYETRQNHRS